MFNARGPLYFVGRHVLGTTEFVFVETLFHIEIVVPASEYRPVSMIRTMRAQIRPYSTAVAPRGSANNVPRRFIYSPVDVDPDRGTHHGLTKCNQCKLHQSKDG